jgi:hypothetical protein
MNMKKLIAILLTFIIITSFSIFEIPAQALPGRGAPCTSNCGSAGLWRIFVTNDTDGHAFAQAQQAAVRRCNQNGGECVGNTNTETNWQAYLNRTSVFRMPELGDVCARSNVIMMLVQSETSPPAAGGRPGGWSWWTTGRTDSWRTANTFATASRGSDEFRNEFDYIHDLMSARRVTPLVEELAPHITDADMRDFARIWNGRGTGEGYSVIWCSAMGRPPIEPDDPCDPEEWPMPDDLDVLVPDGPGRTRCLDPFNEDDLNIIWQRIHAIDPDYPVYCPIRIYCQRYQVDCVDIEWLRCGRADLQGPEPLVRRWSGPTACGQRGYDGPCEWERVRSFLLPDSECAETWEADWDGIGRLAWAQDIFAQHQAGGTGPTYFTNRHDQLSNRSVGTLPCTDTITGGFCTTPYHSWLNLSRWEDIIEQIRDPERSNSQLTNFFNNIRDEAISVIEDSETSAPPHFNISENNQMGLQEGALFDFRTQDRWANLNWNVSRIRERPRGMCRFEAITEYVGGYTERYACGSYCRREDDNGNCTSWGTEWCSRWIVTHHSWTERWWDYPEREPEMSGVTQPLWGPWQIRDNICHEVGPTGICLGTTPIEGITGIANMAPNIGSWQDVEWRQLLSTRCNASGALIASSQGQIHANPTDVDSQFFNMLISHPQTSQAALPWSSLPLNFFTATESCREQINCINDRIFGTTSENNLRNLHQTNVDGINRWGANWIAPEETIPRSTDRFQFARDNQWAEVWIDLWRPSMNMAGRSVNSWRWLDQNSIFANIGEQHQRHVAHTTQIRFNPDGTPGPEENLGGFTVHSRPQGQLFYDDINLANPLAPRLLTNEHTQFRTRASWASNYNAPHQTNLQWIWNAGVRTWAPTRLIGGEEGNRANISGVNSTFERNDFDIFCRATVNTNTPQSSVMRFHQFFGADYTSINRAIIGIPGVDTHFNSLNGRVGFGNNTDTWLPARTIEITFVRPVGE